MQFEIGRTSRLGNREINQDSLCTIEAEQGVVLVLGDGLGGKPGGDLASQTLIGTISEQLAIHPLPAEQPEKFLRELLRRAHHAILMAGQEQQPPITPGTTAVIALVQDGTAWWAHVGDSRLYLFRNGVPLYRTQDHSYVEELYQAGRISLQKTHDHPMRNYVTKCIGLFNKEPEIEVSPSVPLLVGDILLLCSDGFWEPLDEAQLGALIQEGPLNTALDNLAERAEAASYPHSDNTSALALRVTSLQQPGKQVNEGGKKTFKPMDTLNTAIEEINRAIKDYEDEMKK